MVATAKRISKGKERALQMRAENWPEVPSEHLWNRTSHDGYTTIPRTLALVMTIIDNLTKNQPAGRTYFGLWCRTYDESVVIIENPMSLAFEAGFTGERALTTWRQRMQSLLDLGFIDARPGSSGPFHYVLLFNPHWSVWRHKPLIQSQTFSQLLDRALDIGATDLRKLAPVEPQQPQLHKKTKAPKSEKSS